MEGSGLGNSGCVVCMESKLCCGLMRCCNATEHGRDRTSSAESVWHVRV